MYDEKNYQGRCQFFTSGCSPITINTVNSILVKEIDLSPSGSVTFDRNPFFNENAGYLSFEGSAIGSLY